MGEGEMRLKKKWWTEVKFIEEKRKIK